MDPGTAVGVASLGIQVCEGLLKYYEDWRDYEQDVATAYEKIFALSATFKLLQCSGSSPAVAGTAADANLQERLAACDDGIEKLKKKLTKIRIESPDSIRDKAKAKLLRLAYPFKKSTLEKLKETVDELMQHLDAAIQIVQLDVAATTYAELCSVSNMLGAAGSTVDRIESTTNASKIQLDIVSGRTAAISEVAHRLENKAENAGLQLNMLATTMSEVQQTGVASFAVAETTGNHMAFLLSQSRAAHVRDVLIWLSAPDPSTDHANARKKHEPLTGEWFLRSSEYQAWLHRERGHLWVHGKPGCCKTVLSSTIVEDARSYLDAQGLGGRLAYFYFSFTAEAKQTYEALLASIIEQWTRHTTICGSLEQAFRSNVKDIAMLETILFEIIGERDPWYLVIDALDECPEADDHRCELLEGLSRMINQKDNLHILVTSRKAADIERSLASLPVAVAAIDESAVNADIALYTEQYLKRDDKLKNLNSELKFDIRETISTKAGGMFRWAYCQLEEVKKLKILRPQHVRKALKRLPATLDETYERILSDIDADLHEDAMRALRWLAFSHGQISVEMLVEACLISTQNPPLVDEDSRHAMHGILDVLSSLVTVAADPDDMQKGVPLPTVRINGRPNFEFLFNQRIVQLAHFSVKEFLTSPERCSGRASPTSAYLLVEAESHFLLAQECTAYILHHLQDADLIPQPVEVEPDTERLDHLLECEILMLGYARANWFKHLATAGALGEGIDAPILHYQLLAGARDFAQVQEFCPQLSESYDDYDWERTAQVFYGHHGDRFQQSGTFLTTCLNRDTASARVLLRHGADPDANPIYDYSALRTACLYGHKEIVELLVEFSADLNAELRGGTGLHFACDRGHIEIVDLLLQSGANPNAGKDWKERTVLEAVLREKKSSAVVHEEKSEAVLREKKSERIVTLLLKAGADFSISDLKTAFDDSNTSMVKLLIETGRVQDVPDDMICEALVEDNDETWQILLEGLVFDKRTLVLPDDIKDHSIANVQHRMTQLVERKPRHLQIRRSTSNAAVTITDDDGALALPDEKWCHLISTTPYVIDGTQH